MNSSVSNAVVVELASAAHNSNQQLTNKVFVFFPQGWLRSMDVYRQASDVVKLVREGKGTAKALCLRKEMQKKRQTYAVVCETLRHYELLEDVLDQAEFFKYYPQASRALAMVLAYDCVIGKGINTKNNSTAVAVDQSGPYLRDAYERVRAHHIIVPRVRESLEEFDEQGVKKEATTTAFPRYGRVNTLKIAVDEFLSRVRRPKRLRDGTETAATLQFVEDAHVPGLLVFPHGTDLHNHPSVRSAQLVLQDKSSCLPACVLLDAVPVVTTIESQGPLQYVIDACAAPGNKTSQLAAIGFPDIKIMAIERDAKRAEILYQRITTIGAGEHVNVKNCDFFDLTSDDRNVAEAILLDPSCSASGVVSRVDVALKKRTAVEEQEDGAKGDDRVEKLARVQKKLLMHALLSFPLCRRVVYSTCSIHEAEDEDVVRAVLSDERVQKRGWVLANIMPETWPTRGIFVDGDAFPLYHTIRCDPARDRTNGFYVARFDRVVTPEVAAAEEDTVAAVSSDEVKEAADESKPAQPAEDNEAKVTEVAAKPNPRRRVQPETTAVVITPQVSEALKILRTAPPKRIEYNSDSD